MNKSTPGGSHTLASPGPAERVSEIVCGPPLQADALAEKLASLAKESGDEVYAEYLYLMAHLTFDAAEAKSHFNRILETRSSMEQRLGSRVDVRVALVSYFVDINRKLENPKIMELRLFQETQASAYRDELTGLHNFRYLREHLAGELERVDRYGTSLSLFMVDVDDFKLYNDLYGHPSGNRVLVSIAEIINDSIRATDMAIRYGGEEFVMILPSTPKSEARTVAERIRQRIEQQALGNHDHQKGACLTASLGIATYPADATRAEDLLHCADSAMYLAKSQGKNMVCLYGQDRRSFRRIATQLEGHYCGLSEEVHSFRTLDVSEGGLLVIADCSIKDRSLLAVNLRLPGAEKDIECTGRVVRVEEQEQGVCTVALRIAEISQQDRFKLTRFIRGFRDQPETGQPT